MTTKTKCIHFITKFCWNIWKWQDHAVSTKTTPISQRFDCCLPGSLLVAVKKISLLVMRWQCRPKDRVTANENGKILPFQPRESPSSSSKTVPQGTYHASHSLRFTEKNEWPPISPNLNSLDYHVCGTMLTKHHKLQPKPEKVWVESHLACRPSGKSCHKNTWARQWQTSPSTWLPVWLSVVVTLSICRILSGKKTIGTQRNGAVEKCRGWNSKILSHFHKYVNKTWW